MIDIQEIDRWCATCANRFREPLTPRPGQTRFRLSLVTQRGEHAIYLCAVCEEKLAAKIRLVNQPTTADKRPAPKNVVTTISQNNGWRLFR